MLIVTVNGEGLEEEEDEEHPHNSSGNRKTDKKRYRVFMGGLPAFWNHRSRIDIDSVDLNFLFPVGDCRGTTAGCQHEKA